MLYYSQSFEMSFSHDARLLGNFQLQKYNIFATHFYINIHLFFIIIYLNDNIFSMNYFKKIIYWKGAVLKRLFLLLVWLNFSLTTHYRENCFHSGFITAWSWNFFILEYSNLIYIRLALGRLIIYWMLGRFWVLIRPHKGIFQLLFGPKANTSTTQDG